MIEVKSWARLHLGLLDSNGDQGRLYGSMGVAVDRPYLILQAEKSEKMQVEGLDTERVGQYAQRFVQHFGLSGGARLKLLASIPAHVGLGSGTQIALAVGTALARLAGLKIDTREIALVMGRGVRSGIGIATFQRGGFVVDGGHRILPDPTEPGAGSGRAAKMDPNSIPPVLFQHAVPRDWFFITAIPGTEKGFSGEAEDRAFRQLPSAPASLAEKVSRLLLMKMLPALVEMDILSFGQALTEIQCMVGDFFAAVQGGRYSNPLSGRIIDFILQNGAAGAGQSSWGPAVYGVVGGKKAALWLFDAVKNFLAEQGGGAVFCMRAQNRGAQIRWI